MAAFAAALSARIIANPGLAFLHFAWAVSVLALWLATIRLTRRAVRVEQARRSLISQGLERDGGMAILSYQSLRHGVVKMVIAAILSLAWSVSTRAPLPATSDSVDVARVMALMAVAVLLAFMSAADEIDAARIDESQPVGTITTKLAALGEELRGQR